MTTIYTAGYEGASLEDFIERLRRARVELVVDVRDAPISRKRGFSKGALSLALAEAGIRYQHIRKLGCPKPIRDRHREDGDWDRYTMSFLRHLAKQTSAVNELAKICKNATAALLCYEADSSQCHRTYVARAVASVSTGLVMHIGAAGAIRDQESAAAA